MWRMFLGWILWPETSRTLTNKPMPYLGQPPAALLRHSQGSKLSLAAIQDECISQRPEQMECGHLLPCSRTHPVALLDRSGVIMNPPGGRTPGTGWDWNVSLTGKQALLFLVMKRPLPPSITRKIRRRERRQCAGCLLNTKKAESSNLHSALFLWKCPFLFFLSLHHIQLQELLTECLRLWPLSADPNVIWKHSIKTGQVIIKSI